MHLGMGLQHCKLNIPDYLWGMGELPAGQDFLKSNLCREEEEEQSCYLKNQISSEHLGEPLWEKSPVKSYASPILAVLLPSPLRWLIDLFSPRLNLPVFAIEGLDCAKESCSFQCFWVNTNVEIRQNSVF